MNKKKLLILNGSHSEITIIEAAQKLGYYVVTTGNDPSLVGHAYADEYIPADYSDKEAILSLVKDNDISRIVSCANDFGVLTASYVADIMGWPGHDSFEVASMLHEKDNFKKLIQGMGVRCPESIPFSSKAEAIDYLRDATYPVIVKAVDLTGGKGIMRADSWDEAVEAVENAYEKSRSKRIVIEPFIVGVQQSVDTFLRDGHVIALVSNDVYAPINPYLIQSETLPAKGFESIREELCANIEAIARKLKLVDGMFTMQYILKDGKPYVIEAMRRCLGNQFLTVAHASSGFPWEEALVRAETGMELGDLKLEKPRAKYVGHHGIMAPMNGVVRGYSIAPELESHLFKKIDILRAGDRITDYLNQRLAYLYYEFDDRDEMDSILATINDRIKVSVIEG